MGFGHEQMIKINLLKLIYYEFICLMSFFFPLQIVYAHQINFQHACEAGDLIVIAAAGDLLLHKPLQKKAANLGYRSLWQSAIPFLKHADVAYINLEGPIARNVLANGRISSNANNNFDYERIYTDYPLFNYHPSLADDLKLSGIDIVSTANNHALDRRKVGIRLTIEELNRAKIKFSGTRLSQTNDYISITHKNSFKIAWIACTEHTNGIEDGADHVLYCYKQKHKQFILQKIAALKHSVDAIIVTPHWGEEYNSYPTTAQKNFAKSLLDAGALAVIGSHPHVLQPMEKYYTKDGRETFIMYSLGNFVSFQGGVNRRATIILFLGLTKTKNGTVINGVRFKPMYMENRNGMANLKLEEIRMNPQRRSQAMLFDLLPMDNALYGFPLITNPSCQKRISSVP